MLTREKLLTYVSLILVSVRRNNEPQITPKSLYIDSSKRGGWDDRGNPMSRAKAARLGKGETAPQSEVQVRLDAADFVRAASYSESLLKAGDAAGYVKHLQRAIAPRGRFAATIRDREIRLLRLQ